MLETNLPKKWLAIANECFKPINKQKQINLEFPNIYKTDKELEVLKNQKIKRARNKNQNKLKETWGVGIFSNFIYYPEFDNDNIINYDINLKVLI